MEPSTLKGFPAPAHRNADAQPEFTFLKIRLGYSTRTLLPAGPRRRLAARVGAGPRGPKLSLAQNCLNTCYLSGLRSRPFSHLPSTPTPTKAVHQAWAGVQGTR